MLHDDGSRIVAWKRRRTRAHLIEYDAERINITAGIGGRTHQLFWRCVDRCVIPVACVTRPDPGQFAYAEVGDNRFAHRIARCILFIEQDVRWLELTMNYPMLVCILIV